MRDLSDRLTSHRSTGRMTEASRYSTDINSIEVRPSVTFATRYTTSSKRFSKRHWWSRKGITVRRIFKDKALARPTAHACNSHSSLSCPQVRPQVHRRQRTHFLDQQSKVATRPSTESLSKLRSRDSRYIEDYLQGRGRPSSIASTESFSEEIEEVEKRFSKEADGHSGSLNEKNDHERAIAFSKEVDIVSNNNSSCDRKDRRHVEQPTRTTQGVSRPANKWSAGRRGGAYTRKVIANYLPKKMSRAAKWIRPEPPSRRPSLTPSDGLPEG
jgi:hypothetical protein